MSEISQYDYELPVGRIAQVPLKCRTDARLMYIDRRRQSIEHYHVRDLPELLRATDCLVLNDTRVVPARLVGRRTATGGRWEGLFLEADAQGFWRVMARTRGKPRAGETVTLIAADGTAQAVLRLAAKEAEGVWVVRPEPPEEPALLLARAGRVPLPPYIRKGRMVEGDRDAYQTVFARTAGAVAAPTAGLHFTAALLEKLAGQGIAIEYLTLHVGQGTFRAVEREALAEHVMHAEWGEIAEDVARRIEARRAAGGRVVAVGTTSVRLLESAHRNGRLGAFRDKTNLFIRPPYEFRAVDCLMTNFHLPRTTLLVLVRTFGGEALLRRAYEEAIREEYRFYSYGDAMLVV